MNDNLPLIELPEFCHGRDRLAEAIKVSRDAVSLRVGYEVEVDRLEPIEREGHMNMRVFWRRKPAQFHIVN